MKAGEGVKQNNCAHEWDWVTGAAMTIDGAMPAMMQCRKCNLMLSSTEAVQLETVHHLLGFQKWTALIALAVSIIALIVSFIK